MIYDFATEVTLGAPTGSAHINATQAFDLTDGNDGVPPLFGAGQQLYVQFTVSTAFTKGTGDALAQFGITIGEPGDRLVLAMTGGSIKASPDRIGFEASELTLGKRFHLAIPPFDDVLEKSSSEFPNTVSAASVQHFYGLKWMGILCQNPMDVSSVNRFTAGEVKARIVTQASLGTAVLAHQYPNRSKIL